MVLAVKAGGELDLGLKFDSLPPSPAIVGSVAIGSWAHANDVRRGDELLAINGASVAVMSANHVGAMLSRHPLQLVFRCEVDFGKKLVGTEYDEEGPPTSPRAVAHLGLLNALTAHDGAALVEAIDAARAAGVSDASIAAAERALHAFGGPEGPRRRKEMQQLAADKLAEAIASQQERAIDEAILFAIDAGLEDGIAEAEQELVKCREARERALEALVSTMEICVLESENSVATTGAAAVPPHVLGELKRRILEARRLCRVDDETIDCASKLLRFEEQRFADLRNIRANVQGQMIKLEGIADAVEQSLKVEDGTSSGWSADLPLDSLRAAGIFDLNTPTFHHG